MKEKDILQLLTNGICYPTEPIDLSSLYSYEIEKSLVRYKLINYAANQKLLSRIPHIEYLDLAIVFYLSLVDREILVDNKRLDIWNVNIKKLYEDTTMNMTKYKPYVCIEIFELLALTSKDFKLGAASILYSSALADIASKYHKDIIIVPASIHELLLFLDVPEIGYEEWRAYISNLNENTTEDLQLSNNIYLYNCKNHKINIV